MQPKIAPNNINKNIFFLDKVLSYIKYIGKKTMAVKCIEQANPFNN
ncbi:hypothetical protein M111_4210, partial [Bacteroides fragilis str. 3986T(B)10]